MSNRVVALVGVLVGGVVTIINLLVAFGVNITPHQNTAIVAVSGLILLAVSAWFHPSNTLNPANRKPLPPSPSNKSV